MGHPRTALVVPDRQFVKLSYIDTDSPVIVPGGASAYGYNTYYLNSAYDFNAALASTSIPGFQEWSYLYRNYRVMAVKASITAVNNATGKPVIVGFIANPYATGLLTSWKAFMESTSNPHTRQRELSSPGGMDRASFKIYVPLAKLIGDRREYLADDHYSAAISASPAVLLYGYLYCATASGNFFGGGDSVQFRARFSIYVEFFKRTYQTT